MGRGKQRFQRNGRRWRQQHQGSGSADEDDSALPTSAFDISLPRPREEGALSPTSEEEEARIGPYHLTGGPSKYELYQISVQSPKGDISYLQKFFLQYIGGRSPIHLREDFCGTALICAEWLKGGIDRLATGLDLDLEALTWGLSNNFEKVGGNACGRIRLLHGNVLQPLSSAKVVSSRVNAYKNDKGKKRVDCNAFCDVDEGHNATDALCTILNGSGLSDSSTVSPKEGEPLKKDPNKAAAMHSAEVDGCNSWPAVDMVCAFNYSCCCLHERADLMLYLKHVRSTLSEKGGVFTMDLYGGISSEGHLKFRRHFPDFTYVWEQEAFDVISRMTKINLHFQLKNNRMMRHAFTYHWRLWSLPEVRDCVKEAGFDSVHFWVRHMPSLEETEDNEDTWDDDSKYEEITQFYQQSAWNAYVVAVASGKNQSSRCISAKCR